MSLGLFLVTRLPAQGFDTSTPLGFFTSVAGRFLAAQPGFAQAGLSVTNIPIYPTNCYTPAVHRLLQLAANLGDASTNHTAAPPLDFDYPSVFRPTFGVTITDVTTNVYINGYVEVTTNADYNNPAFSLPSDLAAFLAADPANVNVYGVPWVIGAKMGLPNFNQVCVQSFSEIARRVQIVKPNLIASRSTWQTNIQYIVSITNLVAVQAWNSYVNPFTRPVTIGCLDSVTTVMTNENGIVMSFTNTIGASPLGTGILVSNWAGYPFPPTNVNNPGLVMASFRIPTYTSIPFMPESVYHSATGVFTVITNVATVPFDAATGFPLPLFGLNITNRLRFVMVDQASGRVIDYVHLDDMTCQRNLVAELQGMDDFGPGGVWATNRLNGTTNVTDPLLGVLFQIQASLQLPPYRNSDLADYPTTLTANDWSVSLPFLPNFSSVSAAVASFSAFYNRQTNLNSQLSNQVPFTPVRQANAFFTWQANDPLVHYTLSDLTGLGDFFKPAMTNYVYTNVALSSISRVNNRYSPWMLSVYQPQLTPYTFNLSLKDPLVTCSDDWTFPAGSLNFGSVGRVHRGTPWQTVYLKSSSVDPVSWQNWTGNANPADAALAQPTNDWQLIGLLEPLLNSQDPRQLASINQTNLAAVLGGITVVTNSSPLAYLAMDSNSPQAATIVAGVNNVRASLPGQFFRSLGDILAVPELTISSPWLAPAYPPDLADSDYELIPSQLLALLRPDSVGSVSPAGGSLQWQFTGFDGYPYVLEASSNLQDWTPLATLFTTNGSFIFSDPAAASFDRRFYRTSLAPAP